MSPTAWGKRPDRFVQSKTGIRHDKAFPGPKPRRSDLPVVRRMIHFPLITELIHSSGANPDLRISPPTGGITREPRIRLVCRKSVRGPRWIRKAVRSPGTG